MTNEIYEYLNGLKLNNGFFNTKGYKNPTPEQIKMFWAFQSVDSIKDHKLATRYEHALLVYDFCKKKNIDCEIIATYSQGQSLEKYMIYPVVNSGDGCLELVGQVLPYKAADIKDIINHMLLRFLAFANKEDRHWQKICSGRINNLETYVGLNYRRFCTRITSTMFDRKTVTNAPINKDIISSSKKYLQIL